MRPSIEKLRFQYVELTVLNILPGASEKLVVGPTCMVAPIKFEQLGVQLTR